MAAQSQNSNTPVEGLDEQLQEEVEQVDELSKGTLGSYVKKASQSAADHGMQAGRKQAERDEVDRSTNRHGNVDKDAVHKAMKTTHSDVSAPEKKASKRLKGINTAVKKLTREEEVVEKTLTPAEKVAESSVSDRTRSLIERAIKRNT